MDIKNWLDRGRNLNQRIQALEESKAMAYTSATSTTASSGGGGRGGSDISRKAERYSELSCEIDQERKRLDRIMAEITALIGHIENNTLATLLQDRYVRCLGWEQVAADLNYSCFHVTHHLHPKALRAAKDALECTYSDMV